MERIIDYKLVYSTSLAVEKKVREAIDRGWQPWGHPFFDKEHGLFIQAMVKKVKAT